MDRTVTITRKQQAIDPFTGIYVYLDGQQVGMVKNGEELTFRVDNKRHLVKVGFSFNSDQGMSHSVIREGTENYRFTVYVKKGFLADKAILEEQLSGTGTVSDPAEPAVPASSGAKAAFCPACGYKLSDTDNFCPKCGCKRRGL